MYVDRLHDAVERHADDLTTLPRLRDQLVDRYRLTWSLVDLAVYVDSLGGSRLQSADTTWSWDAFLATPRQLPQLRHGPGRSGDPGR